MQIFQSETKTQPPISRETPTSLSLLRSFFPSPNQFTGLPQVSLNPLFNSPIPNFRQQSNFLSPPPASCFLFFKIILHPSIQISSSSSYLASSISLPIDRHPEEYLSPLASFLGSQIRPPRLTWII